MYYDQVHGNASGAYQSMSKEWWDMLKYAAATAQDLGLSFEMAVGNGYVTGGPWITPELAMKKTIYTDTLILTDKITKVDIPIVNGDYWDIAALMFYMPTGTKTKHGRKNLLGFEADVMSAEAANIHYDNYFKAVYDTLSSLGCAPAGLCMDSHEAGCQNWTRGLETIFLKRRGYSLTPYYAAMAGYIGRRCLLRLQSFLLTFRRENQTPHSLRKYRIVESGEFVQTESING